MQMSTRSTIRGAMTRWLIAVAVLALVVSPGIARMSSSRDQALDGLSGTKVAAKSIPQFKIKGKIKGLYPGARKKLTLRVTNTQRYRIKITSLRVKVSNSNKAGCEAKWIRPKKTVRVALLIPARAKIRVSYPVRMSKKAPNACQGARWPLRFSGKAVKHK
jgi:hypothetical protein